MSRSVPEWIGRTDDTPVPPRARLRILMRFGRRCDPAGGCGRAIRPGDAWTCDHVEAIINGGANRERNLHPLWAWCEPVKTRADVRLKSIAYRKGCATPASSSPRRAARCRARWRAVGAAACPADGSDAKFEKFRDDPE